VGNDHELVRCDRCLMFVRTCLLLGAFLVARRGFLWSRTAFSAVGAMLVLVSATMVLEVDCDQSPPGDLLWWQLKAAQSKLLPWCLNLVGLFSAMPMRYFAPSWLCCQVLLLVALPSVFWTSNAGNVRRDELAVAALPAVLLSGIVTLTTSALAERQSRHSFLLQVDKPVWSGSQQGTDALATKSASPLLERSREQAMLRRETELREALHAILEALLREEQMPLEYEQLAGLIRGASALEPPLSSEALSVPAPLKDLQPNRDVESCDATGADGFDKRRGTRQKAKSKALHTKASSSPVAAARSPEKHCMAAEDGDCLPPSACVWTEGSTEPLALKDVKLGMKILTVDPLRNPSMSFASVRRIEITADAEQDQWVKVGLADGTEAMMTASHAMWPEGTTSNSGYTLGALRAEDLVPGVDSLMCLSIRPVPVQSVTPVSPEDAPSSRVQLDLGWEQDEQDEHHPSRRGLLLALPKKEPGETFSASFVAVGDSVIRPAPTRFDALEEIDGDSASQTTKSASWPSTASGQYYLQRQGEGGQVEAEVEDREDVEIVLGGIDEWSAWVRAGTPDGQRQWQRTRDFEAARTVRLSDISSLPRGQNDELMSFGSIGHLVHNETCKVCVFNRKSGTSCRNGWACSFCHAWHRPYVRPRRPDKRRQKQDEPDDASLASTYVGSSAGASTEHRGSARGLGDPWYVNLRPSMEGPRTNGGAAAANGAPGGFGPPRGSSGYPPGNLQ